MLHSTPEEFASPQKSCSPSVKKQVVCSLIYIKISLKTRAATLFALTTKKLHCTSFITLRTAEVSGVYNNFPINSGFIPRHIMRERGLDSRPWIKLLQNGAENTRKGRTQGSNVRPTNFEKQYTKYQSQFLQISKNEAHFILELWYTCHEYIFSKRLTGVIVMFQICVLSAVFSQEGLDVVVFIPVE